MKTSAAPKEWKALRDGSFVRDLVGGEIFMAWSHDHRHGGGRFTGGIDLQTSFTVQETERRLKTAWLRSRARHPLLGITFKVLGRGGSMTYPVFQDEASALNWRRNTIIFLREEDFGGLDDVMYTLDNHNTHPSDGHAKLYVVARSDGRVSLLLNASHALLDVFSSGVVWQTLIDEFALATPERESEKIQWGTEVANLPRPIANVLGEQHPQSWFEWLGTMFTAIKALRNVKAESISPPLHPELASRSLGTASHTQIFTEEETTRFVKRCKEAKTTVTYAYIAILALAMQDLYADESKGIPSQVFAMPYNGRRWLPAGLSPAPPHSPSLGNSNAYIKVPHSGHALRFVASKSSENDKELRLALQAARVKRILEFGERYKENSLKILNSKTPDGVLASKTLVPLLVKAMEKSDPDKPTVSIFGVVSQGQLDKMFPSKANVEGSDIIVVNYQNGGRTVDSNPLMILYTWRGRMHVRYKWNSKYFAQKTFEDIDSKTLEYLKDFVEATI